MPPRLTKKLVSVPRDYYIALEDAASAAANLFSEFSADAVEGLETALEKLDEMSPDTEDAYPYASDVKEEETPE